MGRKIKKKTANKTKMSLEWAMKAKTVPSLSLSRFCNEPELKNFQKKTGFPVIPALLINMSEEQSLIVISPLTGPKAKKAEGLVISTGTVSDTELAKQIKTLKKYLKKA
jgi:hypothetical protein